MSEKWNVPSLVAFGLLLAASVALFATGRTVEGGLTLGAALTLCAPTPLRPDND